MSEETNTEVTSLTVQLLSAYLSNNTVASGDLAELIATTRSALAATVNTDPVVEEQSYEPAVSVRKSLGSRDYIISMIDGKSYKMLKRHLSLHGLTPAEYRARYNLPSDYPMVAAAYSERRREVAKTLGLGRKGRPAPVDAEAATQAATAKPAAKAKSAKKAPVAAVQVAPEEQAAAPAPKAVRKKASRPAAEVSAPTSGEGAVAAPAAKRAKKSKPEGEAPVARGRRMTRANDATQDTSS